MGKAERERELELKLFTFKYIHPRTSCFMSGDEQTREVTADRKESAKAVAENIHVICDSCRIDYQLQR